jgi:hypothetical protein
MKRRNPTTTFLIGFLVVVVLSACTEQTYPMPSTTPDPEFDAAFGVPMPDGTPCHELFEPATEGDPNGALLPGTHGGDLVSGWAFEMKQPAGFKDHGCQVVSSPHPVRQGQYSFRFEVRDGDCNSNDGWDDCTTDRSRHELSQSWRPEAVYGEDMYPNKAGDDFWYGWSMWLPPKSLQQGKTSTFIGQFNSDNSARFYLRDFKNGFGYTFNDRNYDLIAQDTVAPNPDVRGHWVDVMMHVVWSEGDTGRIELYLDGELTKTLTGPNMDGATRTTFDFGIYNAFISKCRCDVMLTQHMYFDELRRGTTRQDVELAPHDPNEVGDKTYAPGIVKAKEVAVSSGFPRTCQAWEGIQNRPDLTELERLASHDLVISTPHVLNLDWVRTDDQPYPGLSTTLEATWNGKPSVKKDALHQLNPNFTFIASVFYREGPFVGDEATITDLWKFGDYPPDSPFWIRDESNEPVPAFGMDNNLDGVIQPEEIQLALVDFRNPDLIELIAQKAFALEQSGVVDGIFLDWWNEHHRTAGSFLHWDEFYMTLEEEVEARLAILRRIRELVSDDFLIVGNTNQWTAPLSAPYLNGMFMEAVKADTFSGYTTEELQTIEDSLYWGSENLREPRTSCLEGWRVVYNYVETDHDAQIAERNSEENQRWMRLITTLSLTHSDGNVVFGADPIEAHAHNWYEFWDADLGQPLGPKRTTHQDINGLFIREFTNGYVVYNRSGSAQEIAFEHQYQAVSQGHTRDTHLVADMDGEIFVSAS